MSVDRTCTREIYLGLFVTAQSPETPVAKYKTCGSLMDGRQLFCNECQADIDARDRRHHPAADYTSQPQEGASS